MQILVRKSSYVIIFTYHSMHSIHGYIIGNTAFCKELVVCHMKLTAIHRFYTNIISYTRADNLCLPVIYNLRYIYSMLDKVIVCRADFITLLT